MWRPFRERTKRGAAVDTDPLTGLASHRGFRNRLEVELERAAQDRRPLAVVAIDLDRFGAFNRAYGHDRGDALLESFAETLTGCVRATDHLARVGADEFALILAGSDSATAEDVVERIRIAARSRGQRTEFCAGIAAFPAAAGDSSVWGLAKAALDTARAIGPGQTRRFDSRSHPDHAASSDGEVDEIAALLDRPDAVEPLFEPVVELATGRLAGYALVPRFPALGDRRPSAILAQAHACGRGPELEAAMIRAALARPGPPAALLLKLDLSPAALSSRPIREALRGRLTGLVINLTGHDPAPDDVILAGSLAELREAGAKIGIGAVGGGGADLTRLLEVRPDFVSLDPALTANAHADPVRFSLVESLARFVRSAGGVVCAAGIETVDDLVALAHLDVGLGRGRALGEPAPGWGAVAEQAVRACRAALTAALGSPDADHPGGSDRRIVQVSARLAGARSRDDIEEALAALAVELAARDVALSRWHPRERVLQTLANGRGDRRAETFPIDDFPASERVVREQIAVAAAVGDPLSDPDEVELLTALGHGSLLILPVVSRGATLGILEVFRADQRPWARAEINRARVIANQLASVISALFRPGSSLA